jgi:hypothetical protein
MACVKTKLDVPNEWQECLAFYKWAQSRDDLRGLLVRLPNDGKRTGAAGHYMRMTGLTRGLPDFMLLVPRPPTFHGLFIEMKRRDGGRKSVEQDAMLLLLNKQGYCAVYAHGADEAIKKVEQYLTYR